MSRPFHFGLQKVLDYREQLEEQAKMEMARAQMAYQKQVDLAEQIRSGLEAHIQSKYVKPMSPNELWLWEGYKVRLQEELQYAEAHMMELAKILNKARREAVVKSKERKLLDKLKENQKRQHVADEQYKEQQGFDEMATMRFRPETF